MKPGPDIAMPAVPPAEEFERHGLLARALLVIVGAVFGVAGAVVLIFVSLFWINASRDRQALLGAVALFFTLLSAVVMAYGWNLVRRGVRGRSRRRFTRANSWYFHNWYAISVVTWGVLVVGGMLAAGGPTELLLSRNTSAFQIAWHGFLLYLVLPIHVTLHELGHAAAGALVGLRFSMLRVGWLVIHREGTRFRFAWNRTSLAGVLGFHLGVPEGTEDLGLRLFVHAACGPATTLAVAAACRAGATAIAPAPTLGSAVGLHLLLAGWWVGIFLGILNLLPFRTRSGWLSDGAHMLTAVLPRSPGANALMRARIFSVQGRRPRDWGMSAQSLLLAADSERRQRDMLLVLALDVALDRGEPACVEEILRRVAETPPSHPLARYELTLQTAMVEALRGDAAKARERIAGLGPHPTVSGYQRLAEAVVNIAEGNLAEANSALELWEQTLTKSGMGVALLVGNEWAVEALRARLGPRAQQPEISKVPVG